MQKPGLFGMNGVLVFFLSFLSVAAHAQQTGSLILIDAENKQSFTVRIGDQLYASSGHGHLVLSHLRDSSYRLNLRFPKKNLAEQVFPVTIHQKDLGFQLRGNDSTWVLYNWQTKETIRPVNEKDSSRILDQGVRRDDGFSKLMAAVVNDTSVMYNTYTGNGFHADTSNSQQSTVNRQPQTANPPTTVIAQRSTAIEQPPTVNRQPPTALPPPVPVSDKKHVKDSLLAVKKANAATRDSLLAVRKANASKDSLLAAQKAAVIKDSLLTVNRPLPTANSQLPTANPPTTVIGQRSTVNEQPSTVNRQPSTNLPPGIKKLREVSLKISRKLVYLDVGRDGLADTVTLFVYFETNDTAVSQAPLVKNKPVPAQKTSEPGCAQLATEGDLEAVRSAILSANSEQDKMAAASGAFSVKCYTVSQVRILAGLFVSDKSRYRLMEAAHLHISDQDHFRELADMYTDKNFQKKFLLMTGKKS